MMMEINYFLCFLAFWSLNLTSSASLLRLQLKYLHCTVQMYISNMYVLYIEQNVTIFKEHD